MRHLAVVPLTCCWLGVAAVGTVSAQSTASAPAALTAQAAPGAKPAPQPPAKPQAPAPAKPEAPAAATPEEDSESTRSLFDQTWNQFEIGGRATNIDGDPARFQRYADIRDGVLFTDARFAREDPNGAWSFRGSADNVGWRDQRFFGEYEQTGRFVVTGLWDEIPQFYSVDTKTPYTGSGGTLVLDDATHAARPAARGFERRQSPGGARKAAGREPWETRGAHSPRGPFSARRTSRDRVSLSGCRGHQTGVERAASRIPVGEGLGTSMFLEARVAAS